MLSLVTAISIAYTSSTINLVSSSSQVFEVKSSLERVANAVHDCMDNVLANYIECHKSFINIILKFLAK